MIPVPQPASPQAVADTLGLEKAALEKYKKEWHPNILKDVPEGQDIFGVLKTETLSEMQLVLAGLRRQGVACLIRYKMNGIVGAVSLDETGYEGYLANLRDLGGVKPITDKAKKEMELHKISNKDAMQRVLSRVDITLVAPEAGLKLAGIDMSAKIVL